MKAASSPTTLSPKRSTSSTTFPTASSANSPSTYAKRELRTLFSKSPVWHPELDALIINGTRTHNPDYDKIYSLMRTILKQQNRYYQLI